MLERISIYLFDKYIADIYQDGDRAYLKQYDGLASKASPLFLSKDEKEIETTHL